MEQLPGPRQMALVIQRVGKREGKSCSHTIRKQQDSQQHQRHPPHLMRAPLRYGRLASHNDFTATEKLVLVENQLLRSKAKPEPRTCVHIFSLHSCGCIRSVPGIPHQRTRGNGRDWVGLEGKERKRGPTTTRTPELHFDQRLLMCRCIGKETMKE